MFMAMLTLLNLNPCSPVQIHPSDADVKCGLGLLQVTTKLLIRQCYFIEVNAWNYRIFH